jgi:hypothetical protein
MNQIVLPPGNIYSGASGGLAVFTNPTSIAKFKRNLKKDYPIVFRGRKFIDAEFAYKSFSWPGMSWEDRQILCIEVIIAKFRCWPFLVDVISANGGGAWIRQCSHFIGIGKTIPSTAWEGEGTNSLFIKCLLQAYLYCK